MEEEGVGRWDAINEARTDNALRDLICLGIGDEEEDEGGVK